MFGCHIGNLRDRRNLGHPGTGDDSSGTDRPWPDANFDSIGEVNEVGGGFPGPNVTNNHVRLNGPLDLSSAVDDVQVVGMRTVDKEHVSLGLIGSFCPFGLERTDGDPTAQASMLVTGGFLVLPSLENPLHRHQPNKEVLIVNDRHPLDFVLVHQVERLPRIDIVGSRNHFVSHRRTHRIVLPNLEMRPNVRTRDDPKHLPVRVDDRCTANAGLDHHFISLTDSHIRIGGDD